MGWWNKALTYLMVRAPITAAGRKAIRRLRVNITSLRSPRKVPPINWMRRALKIQITARMDPNWMTTSKTLSSPEEKSIQLPRISKCAVLETGMNSVKPSMMPSSRAFSRYRVFSVMFLEVK